MITFVKLLETTSWRVPGKHATILLLPPRASRSQLVPQEAKNVNEIGQFLKDVSLRKKAQTH